jgi:RNA polymerase sigma-70 factor (ECF subfamily)
MSAPPLDPESAAWIRQLTQGGPEREGAERRLHELLLRVARAEAARRRGSIPERGREEVDDLCVQAASDALLAILRKLPGFRGAARFTTWASKFAIFELSTRLRRHNWRHRRTRSGDEVWEQLPEAAPSALATLQRAELLGRLRELVATTLTERQRRVFLSAAMEEVPIDVLAEELGSTRGAVYKILHDARAKLRRQLVTEGYGANLV